MSSRSTQPVAALGDLIRSRLRAFLPLVVISLVGLTTYLFFSSITPYDSPSDNLDQYEASPQHPHFRIDGLGRVGIPQFGPPDLSSLSSLDVGDQPDPKTQPENDPSSLMNLPILQTTFKDPFDPKSPSKHLQDAKSPWSSETSTGVILINRLSRNRFPSMNSADPLRGSSPPPIPSWPPPELLKDKPESTQFPIPKDRIVGLNTSFVWKHRPLIKQGQLPKVQWSGFDRLDWESESDKRVRLERQGWVRRAFQHVWEGYKAHAWGHDELKPISGSFQDPFAGWGATLVDCLDTLLIMNMTTEYNYARTHVKAIDWSYTLDASRIGRYGFYSPTQPAISFFETVIRYMGGLISAYDLSGDELMLQRAEDLAEWLLPAFGTSTGLPVSPYRMGSNPQGELSGRVCIAEIGSLTLEFTRLSQLTSKDFYYDVVQKITDLLDSNQWKSATRLGTLFPTHFNPNFPQSLSGVYTFGAMADSYYEYLIKEYQLLRGTNSQYSKMFTSAIDSARKHLVKTYDLESIEGGKNLTVIGDQTWGNYKPTIDHLTCFAGAMIGLGSKLLNRSDDLDLALAHTDACVWTYESTKTGIGPERVSIMEGDDYTRWEAVSHEGQTFRQLKSNPLPGAVIQDGRYLGRPETIESVFYMWRITGDRQWQDRGWRMFTSWMEASMTQFGLADLSQVDSSPVQLSDKEESFVLAETLKYYYLLFSDPEIISLDEFVLNTEAHPFRVERPEEEDSTVEKGEERESYKKYYWMGFDPEIDKLYDPPHLIPGQTGFGTFLQQWSRLDLNKVKDPIQRSIYKRILGL